MKGGFYFPKGRKTGRVWYWFEKKKYWVQRSVYGEKLFDGEQCKEVLNAIANEIRSNRHHPEEWGRGNILKFPRAWEIFDEQSPCSQVTKDYRNQICRDFLSPYFEKFSLRQIEEEDTKDFFSKLPKDYSPYSLLKIMGVLRTFLNFHRVTWQKRLRYPKISLPQKSIPRLTQEEQFKVLELVEDWHKPVVHFCLTYGCRVSEACNLRKQDINWQERTFTFRERKNKKDHELPILPQIEKYLVGGGGSTWRATGQDKPMGSCPPTNEKYLVDGSGLTAESGHRCVVGYHSAIDPHDIQKECSQNACPPTKVSNLIYVFCTRLGRQYPRQEVTTAWRIANREAHEKFGIPIVSFKNATRHSLVCQMVNEGRTFEEIGSITGNSPRVLERHYGSMNPKRKLEILRRVG